VAFTGTCDASGAVTLTSRQFVVADDEDNVLRIYDADAGGAPLHSFDVSPMLPLRRVRADSRKRERPAPRRNPESDLEAATRVGDAGYWLASHALAKSGKAIPARFLFFATPLPAVGEPITLRGAPYQHLLADMLSSPALEVFDLARAAERLPKEEGGLNIEGLTAMPGDAGVLLGFRNPVPKGRALLVPLLNPAGLIQGQRARFGSPVSLDLAGLGVRALSWWRGRYLIAAGHYADRGPARLFWWDGTSASAQPATVDLQDFNVEALVTPEERDEILLLSDDGTRAVDGVPCKELKDAKAKRFRGLWFRPAGG
jgi:hypothetical protein